ncbi:MAG: type II secretion system protein GspK, partial [Congregibacter sp.]|nr:type II secretion system protein GspK [Congregibacter sp.]
MNCRSASSTPVPSQSGVALVVALLVFAICAAVLVALQRDFDLSYRRALNSFVAEQSWAYLRGAEELAALALRMDYEADLGSERARDDLNEIWAQDPVPYALDEG